MTQETYLILEQRPSAAAGFEELLGRLAEEPGLDAYSCRQRLIGQGYALLHRGQRSALQQLSDLLLGAKIRHWLIEPTRPQFAPAVIRGLEQQQDGLLFTCQKKQVRFKKTDPVLAIFADLSGQLAERSVRQLLASHAYQGLDNLCHLSAEKAYRTILQAMPVLDLYRLDQNHRITEAVRVVPGRFDHRGLGEHASASSRQNLHHLLQLSRENATSFRLETGFGLANLPGCGLHKPHDNPDMHRKNLISLTRFGWLMADLRSQGEVTIPVDKQDELGGSVSAALLAGNPAIAANQDLALAVPVIDEIATELRRPTESSPSTVDPIPPRARPLPAPPPMQTDRQWRSPRFWIGPIGGVLVVSGVILFEATDIFRTLLGYGFRLGVIPALIGAAMFWGGFHFLRLKRTIENTPTSKIRSVAMGMVEVKGKAIRQFALVSPMTHVACAWYRLTKYRRDKNRNWVVSSIVSSGSVPFLLEDATGRICVDPAGATVSSSTRQEGTPGHASMLIGSGLRDRDASEKWAEELIYEGTTLYVLGFASAKRESKTSLREEKIAALRELKRDPDALQAFDHDGDGRISETEWEDARTAVEDRVLHQSLAGRDRRRRQEEQIVIGKPGGGRPFIVAENRSETQLTTRFARYTIPLFIGAAGCTVWAIALLIQFFS